MPSVTLDVFGEERRVLTVQKMDGPKISERFGEIETTIGQIF
jgi:hypothetical protein